VPRVQDPSDQALEPHASYERFFLREYRGVVELAYALSGNRAGAEDIAQEAFLRAHRDWQRVEPALAELPVSGADFWRAVRSLPRRQAQAVALHYLEDLPVADIARVLGCAEGTVKAHLHHGREALGRRLALFEEREP
jgi:RNA polymerase sigma-70 factor, ECF subfamily